jgi:transcriptional regulator with XRE-family HTH domain
MQILSDRLLSIICELGFSQSKFARELGVTFTYVNMLVNKKRKSASRIFVNYIQEKYGYQAGWIAGGKSEKRDIREYNELLDSIYSLPSDEIDLVVNYIFRLEKSQNAG